MSRSYRKFACIKDRCRTSKKRFQPKTAANRKVRHTSELSNHAGYKKVYCSWNISDYRFVMNEQGLYRCWLKREGFLAHQRTFEEARRWWYCAYKRKWFLR